MSHERTLSFLIRQECYAKIICVLEVVSLLYKGVMPLLRLTNALLRLGCNVDHLSSRLGLLLNHVLHEGESEHLLDAVVVLCAVSMCLRRFLRLRTVKNMTNRSIPMPQPPVGGRPYSRDWQKVSSMSWASSSPWSFWFACSSYRLVSTK